MQATTAEKEVSTSMPVKDSTKLRLTMEAT
ncbi:MAG: hypothetical protein FD132_1168 [bacterium]|nr:MAG: hypothetical protein FD132_1168 [bacterium]